MKQEISAQKLGIKNRYFQIISRASNFEFANYERGESTLTAEYAKKTFEPDEQSQTMKPTYIDARAENALNNFSESFYECLAARPAEKTIILCIGSDRATGDCFGPIVGHMLEGSIAGRRGIEIYGTLEKPVHAKNIAETKINIYSDNAKPLVIAIDACLGRPEHVGFIGVGEGSVRPGAGLGKKLPEIGDIFITGVVNFGGVMDFEILQNTRLSLVMRMSEIVHRGVISALTRHRQSFRL